jgi:UDP-N-acetylglucosamine 2-epimerase (non-hydrolysing)
MKVAPVIRALKQHPGNFHQVLVHTGQHYDYEMSSRFFDELDIPKPDHNLEVGSANHGEQTAGMLAGLEKVFLSETPDWVLLYGDTNSAVAGALAAAKLHLRIAHVEAGLRSFDRSMPEEINRLATDHMCDLLLTPSANADENLKSEGISGDKVQMVGNVMIDTVVYGLGQRSDTGPAPHDRNRPSPDRPYALVTLHRPSNVDDKDTLRELLQAISEISKMIDVVFPIHPRTRAKVDEFDFGKYLDGISTVDPMTYMDFIHSLKFATVAITDSGGVQEEATYLGVSCLTIRPNTERPITITDGTNELVASTQPAIIEAFKRVISRGTGGGTKPPPPLWDGHAADRIADVLSKSPAWSQHDD